MSLFKRISLNDSRILILADQSLMSASGFLANFLLAWKLQLETYGQYALVFLGMMLLMSFQQALFIQPAQTLFPRFTRIRQQRLTGALLSVALPVLILISLVFELVFTQIYSLDCAPGILTIVCFIWLISDLLRKLVILTQPTVSMVLLDALNAILFISLILLMSPDSLSLAMAILGISSLIGFGFIGILKPIFPSSRMIRFYISKAWKTAGWMLLTSTVQWSSSNYLLMAAGSWISASALGVLRLIQYVFGLLNIFLQAYENFAVPQVVKFRGSVNGKIRYILRISIPFLAPVAGLMVVMTMLFPLLFSMLNSGVYSDQLQYWFAGLYTLILLGYPIRVYIRASGFNSIYFTAHIASLGVMLTVASFLIQSFQLTGVVLGMILSQLVMILIWVVYIIRKNQFIWKLSTSHLVR